MPEKSTRKLETPSALPKTYDLLLHKYVETLEKTFPNPYAWSIKSHLREWFDIKWQLKYAKSPHISNFIKAPNTLEQELPGAAQILEYLDQYDDVTLGVLFEMNNMNLQRLKRRSINEVIAPGIAFIGSLLGLLPAFQSVFPIALNDAIFPGLPQITISLFLRILMVLALLVGITNRLVTLPRIGLVEALSGILNIAITYRDIKDK